MPYGSGQGDPYNPTPFRFMSKGLQVAKPINFLDPGEYSFFQNFRISQEGRMRSRNGLSALSAGNSPMHSIFRLSDIPNNNYNYFVGVGNSIKFGQAGLTTIETIYNGKPMTAVDARPERSASPRLYVTDGSVMRKFRVDGLAQQWGIFPPKQPPTVQLFPQESTPITDCSSATPESVAENGAVWARQQNATVAMSQVNRTNTTISSIVYDSGTTGYCNIAPAAMGTDIQPGERLQINSGGGTAEFVIVEQTFPAIKSTTIDSIVYHQGTVGLCTIQLATPTAGLVANTLVLLNGAETVRVLSVTNGPDGKPCFRCSTAGTFAAGNTVSGFRNFRAFAANNHAAAETLITKAYEFQINPSAGAPLGLGAVSHNVALDLSSAGGRPITADDEISFGVYFDDLSRLIEGKLIIDLDPATAPGVYAATDATRNFLFYPYRKEDVQRYALPTDPTTQIQASSGNIQFAQIDQFNRQPLATVRDPLTGAVIGFDDLARYRNSLQAGLTQFSLFRGTRRRLLQRYDEALGETGQGGGILTSAVTDSGEFQAGSGQAQWYQLRFKVGDMLRVGTDQSRSLKDSTGLRLQFNLSGTGATVVRISSIWIGGTYGPDSETDSDLLGNAYYYRYIGRNSNTGEIGLPSPPTRAGVIGRRQRRNILPPQHPDPQVDKLDIYRYGGSILQWTYVGTVANGVAPSFNDNLPDEEIASNPLLNFDTFPPVPTADLPRSGNCNVVGTRVTRTGGSFFNPNYAAGTEIVINGRTFLAYASPESNNIWELTESAGTMTGAVFELPNAIIMGNPLPTVFGPYGQGRGGLFYFFIGDLTNPGVLYWTNGNEANSASDLNYLEITGPSEPLVAGCIYDGQPYVITSERMFLITQNLNPNPGESAFAAQEIANSKGAWTRLGIYVDTLIYFIGKDGIYEAEGGQPRSITDDTLYPLFPHEGFVSGGTEIIGNTTLRLPSPDYTKPDSMRLVGDGQFIYFIFQDVSNAWQMFIWEKRARRWYYDTYGDGGLRVIFADKNISSTFVSSVFLPNYLLGGTANGNFVVVGSGAYDVNTSNPIRARLLTVAHDFGDSRTEKRLGDVMLDATTGSDPVTARLYSNNYTNTINTFTPTLATRSRTILDLNSGDEVAGVNISLEIDYTATQGGRLELFEWQPTAVPKPAATFLRATDWDAAGGRGAKFLQGVIIEADTRGQPRTVRVESSDGGLIDILTINHSRQLVRAYSLGPGIGSSFRVFPTDAADWKLYNVDWIYEPAPELVLNWKTQGTDDDIPWWAVTREAWITVISTADVTFTILYDGVAQAYTVPSTAGAHRKTYIPLKALKSKIREYQLASTQPFRLFKKDCAVMLGAWGRTTELIASKPFGGQSRADGAAI